MPGRKSDNTHNYLSHKEWMKGKKIGRPKQEWVRIITKNEKDLLKNIFNEEASEGYWRKIEL